MTSAARINKEAMQWEVRAQYRGPLIQGHVEVRIALFWPDQRPRDIDNLKSLIDSLTGIVWVDDRQIMRLVISKGLDKDDPHVEIEVIPL